MLGKDLSISGRLDGVQDDISPSQLSMLNDPYRMISIRHRAVALSLAQFL